MAMTDRERILAFLRSLSPKAATNSEIQEGTGIESHHQVYELTQELLAEGEIHGVKGEEGWLFWIGEPEVVPQPVRAPKRLRGMSASQFEALARQKMSEHYNVALAPGWVGQVHKRFDFVGPYGRIVGHAQYHARVRSTRWPPAKAATISEHVWLLEKTGAPQTFLVFGNDRQVPLMWLERYGNLVSGVKFFFLSDEGGLEELPNLAAAGAGSS